MKKSGNFTAGIFCFHEKFREFYRWNFPLSSKKFREFYRRKLFFALQWHCCNVFKACSSLAFIFFPLVGVALLTRYCVQGIFFSLTKDKGAAATLNRVLVGWA
jgi:hypothetical protein